MKSTAKPDYDRRYQEDFEKAEALILEPGIDEFRNRELQSESSARRNKTVVLTSTLPKSSMSRTERTDYCIDVSRSRPRAESKNTGKPLLPRIKSTSHLNTTVIPKSRTKGSNKDSFTIESPPTVLLSFVTKVYTMAQEGKIERVEVYGYEKRHKPEKYYLYILKVFRENYKDPSYLFRSYKELSELQQKFLLMFPSSKFLSLLNTRIHMRRPYIKEEAVMRQEEIEQFLTTLFQMAPEMSHSDLVYTFFHPLLRDQQEVSIADMKLKAQQKDPAGHSIDYYENRKLGQLKLTLHYQCGVFMIMVHHARELPRIAGNQKPSTYVKLYLFPDSCKASKRKTRVVKKNCYPTFMEMFEYIEPLAAVQDKILEATLWKHDSFKENEYLGGVVIPLRDIDLTKEATAWYDLKMLMPRWQFMETMTAVRERKTLLNTTLVLLT